MGKATTRRNTLRLGTGAAFSAAATPLMSSPGEKAIPGTSESSSGPSSNAGSNSSHEICFLRAVDILNALRTKKLSAREVMGAHLQQIHRVNPKVNAVVTLVPEDQLMAQASAADEAL
ncbi:MAG: hypothetical protein JOZ45_00720, partial [Acidobacteriaceae bacterium]|nr:hypothetical protein [Acidobacteriaceae bacterium]